MTISSRAEDAIFLTADDDKRQDRHVGAFRGFIQKSAANRRCLEIGAGYNPVLPKPQGFDVKNIDYLDADALRAKYSAMGIGTDLIGYVDYVWKGEPLSELVSGRFHLITAAHVVEHMPDLIAFLHECDRLLEDDGCLSLIIPDKRYCFDIFQPITDAATVIGDHLRGDRKHSFESLYRYGAQVMAEQDGISIMAWYPEKPVRAFTFMHPAAEMHLSQAQAEAASAEYVDSHSYFFTPSTFLAVMTELSFHDLTRFRVETLTRSRYCEFLTVLRKQSDRCAATPAEFLDRKKSLLMNHINELGEVVAQSSQRSGQAWYRRLWRW